LSATKQRVADFVMSVGDFASLVFNHAPFDLLHDLGDWQRCVSHAFTPCRIHGDDVKPGRFVGAVGVGLDDQEPLGETIE
jgi:hypothetical protein